MSSRSARFALMALVACAAGGFALADSLADRDIEHVASRTYNFREVLGGKVGIHVQDGVATLTGRVDTQDDRQLAENTVDLIPNVRRIDNQIRVDGPPAVRSDNWIAMHVKVALLLHRDVSAATTKVIVKDGEVFLDGTATSAAQKQLTETYVHQVQGVRFVMNNLQLTADANDKAKIASAPGKPRRPSTFAGDEPRGASATPRRWDDPAITAQVRYELLQTHLHAATGIKVTTAAGVVTLTGWAENQDEKEAINRAASSAPGIRSLIDLVKVKGQ